MHLKRIIIFALIAATCLSFVGCAATENNFKLEIQTDSMAPVFSTGDKILCAKVDSPGALKKGDIIAYWTVINGERVMNVHRIHEIYHDGKGTLYFQTKGDNNDTADATPVHQDDVVGKYIKKVLF